MTGPQQERLRQNVDGADHGQVTSAGFDWKAKGDLLDIVASQLEFNATAPREAMGGQTGVATSEAFARSGKAMAAKSAELQHGGEILMKSGQAIKNAEDEHRSLGAQPGAPTEPTYDSGSPQTKAELRQHSEHQAAAAAWQAEYDRREKRAEKANLELEQALRGYSNDMAKIHGENMDKPSSVQGGSGSVAAPGGGGTAYGGGGGGGTRRRWRSRRPVPHPGRDHRVRPPPPHSRHSADDDGHAAERRRRRRGNGHRHQHRPRRLGPGRQQQPGARPDHGPGRQPAAACPPRRPPEAPSAPAASRSPRVVA